MSEDLWTSPWSNFKREYLVHYSRTVRDYGPRGYKLLSGSDSELEVQKFRGEQQNVPCVVNIITVTFRKTGCRNQKLYFPSTVVVCGQATDVVICFVYQRFCCCWFLIHFCNLVSVFFFPRVASCADKKYLGVHIFWIFCQLIIRFILSWTISEGHLSLPRLFCIRIYLGVVCLYRTEWSSRAWFPGFERIYIYIPWPAILLRCEVLCLGLAAVVFTFRELSKTRVLVVRDGMMFVSSLSGTNVRSRWALPDKVRFGSGHVYAFPKTLFVFYFCLVEDLMPTVIIALSDLELSVAECVPYRWDSEVDLKCFCWTARLFYAAVLRFPVHI